MFGRFQETQLRIEVEASEATIRRCLLQPDKLRQWLPLLRDDPTWPDEFQVGSEFTSWVGPVPVHHQVRSLSSNTLDMLLSQGIDGYHQWHWGDGWVQSSIAGVSVLPLSLGQTASLLSLKRYLGQLSRADQSVSVS